MAPVQNTQSLAQWFDAGYVHGHGNLSGKRTLPTGYGGADSSNMFIKAKASKVVTWPVRLDLGDMSTSSKKTMSYTLYHYTHRQSLVTCSQIFSQATESSVKEMALRELLHLLKEDCRLRSRPLLDSIENPHAGKLLLTTQEPEEFEDFNAVQQMIFGGSVSRKVLTLSGEEVPSSEIGKCCIAVRIPAVMCSSAKLSGDRSKLFVVNTDRLEREIKGMIASQEKILQEMEMEKKNSKKWCFPWPFTRKSDESRARSKSSQRSEKTGAKKPLIEKDAQAAILERRRACRIKQMNAELESEVKERVQSQNRFNRGHTNLLNAIMSEDKTVRSKSKGASQKGRLSVIDTKPDTAKKVSKFALDLEHIFLATGASERSDANDLNRIERSACSAALKRKGSWKQLSRRQEEALQMQ